MANTNTTKTKPKQQLKTVQQPLPVQQLVKLATSALEDKKGVDVATIKLPDANLADYLVICTATSERHGATLAGNVMKVIDEAGEAPISKEGTDGSEWALVNYGAVVVHIFAGDARLRYNLEKLWAPAFEDTPTDDDLPQSA